MNTNSIKKSECVFKNVTKKAYFDEKEDYEYFFRSLYFVTPPIPRFELEKPMIHSEDEIEQIRERFQRLKRIANLWNNMEELDDDDRYEEIWEEKMIAEFTEELKKKLFQIWYYISFGRHQFDYSQLLNIYPSEFHQHIYNFAFHQADNCVAFPEDLEECYSKEYLSNLEYELIYDIIYKLIY